MKTAIIASKKDLAGMNIAEELKKYDLSKVNATLHIIEQDTIFSDNIDKEINADFFLFATRHQSKEGIPSLSCHSPGNWSKAEAGGIDDKLCIAPADYIKNAFLLLNKYGKKLNHEITLECTHHGPYLEKPCMFIEIGSKKEDWIKKEPAKIIAKVIFELLSTTYNSNKIGFGIGGPHYCSTFNKKIIENNIAIGHICPKYHLENLSKEMISQAIEKTIPKPTFILLDWKGLGKQKQRIMEILKNINIEVIRSDKI